MNNIENTLLRIIEMKKDMGTFEKLGGRDSIFGLIHILHIEMRDSHKLITDEEIKANYPFKGYTQFECYGNIVEEKYSKIAIERCSNEYKFTRDEWRKIGCYLIGKGSPDTVVMALYVSRFVFNDDKYMFKFYDKIKKQQGVVNVR